MVGIVVEGGKGGDIGGRIFVSGQHLGLVGVLSSALPWHLIWARRNRSNSDVNSVCGLLSGRRRLHDEASK